MHIGETVGGRFTLEALRGAGAMGRVYRARDEERGLDVALKLLEAGSADRFGREVAALAALDHPAIVGYVASGRTADGGDYLAMEWLDGEDLGERLARGPLGVEDTISLAQRLAGALGAAHAAGVVHRDIKPNNILLPGGQVSSAKLVDFGIARVATSGLAVTETGGVIGTPAYMAPEQARGDRGVGAAADVFSLGCVLFECLSGKRAFPGDHAIAVLGKVLFEEPGDLVEAAPDVPLALAALVREMLCKSVTGRPSDGGVLSERIAGLASAPAASLAPGAPRPVGITVLEQEIVSVIVISSEATPHDATLAADTWEATCRTLGAVVARHGGRIEKLLGGAMIATIAARGTPSDHARQAARCALSLSGVAPELRIVLATGARVEGRELPVGELLERSVALLEPAGGAAPRGIGVDPVTAALLRDEFEIDAAPPAFALVGARARGLARAPCFGREREIAALRALFDESVAEPAARAALLIGPPGIGKSRLLEQVVEHAARAGAEIWRAGGDPVSAGSPLALVAQAAALSELDALHDGPADAGRIEAARRAFAELVDARCRSRPLVIALEDLHWADLPSVRSIDAALRRQSRGPLFVLATARPEVEDVFPKLWSGRALHEVRVGELGKRAAERLVAERLGAAAGATLVGRIVEQAGGNAFYLEELARTALAGRDDVPLSIVGAVQARLRALDPGARRALRAASVFGQTFSAEGALALLGPDAEASALDATLEDLVECEVLVVGDARGPRGHLGFAHAFVREAAYAMLTAEDRSLGHALAGAWLEHRASAPLVIAYHYESAGDVARAACWHERAAAEALAAGDFVAARGCAERGLHCGAEGEARGRLAALSADASMKLGDLIAAETRGAEALHLLRPGSAEWHLATRAAVARALMAMHS